MQTTREIQNGCPNQASGYEMANKPKIKKTTKKTHGEKEGGGGGGEREREREKTTTLSEKKEGASNVSEQRHKGWIHVIRIHDTTHLAVTTRQGNRRSRTSPQKERMRGLVKHRDYPPHWYIVDERYNSRNKRESQEKKQTANGKNR